MAPMHGFELVREQTIPELNTKARLYRHNQTGAQLLSMENDEENKVFGITFRTPPPDSTGLPHILEHSVLCGSRKYPVKEPFIELAKGSLNTFLNAFTFSDKTCYPVASQNVQDFYNLIDVYLDAVLYPNLTPYTLQQEGWHYELDDIEEPMTYKGVVFNEMKSAYSDPDNLLARYVQGSLFPDTPYGFDSGGDPKVIPNLTFEQFEGFHKTYYHPSNALIYFYGNDDPAERLRILDEYLKDFEPLPSQPPIPLQSPFDAPQRITRSYSVGEDEESENKTILTVNWVLTDVTDTSTVLALHILKHILIGTPASPLRKALIDSGLGEDLAGSGLDSEVRQIYFSTGLKGIKAEDAGQVEQLILNTLRNLAQTGIDRGTVEASLNTIEFSLRENNTGSYPRGLIVMLSALTTWLHDGDPLAPLAFEAPLSTIKRQIEAGERTFETLIERYLIDNPHRTTLLLKPDPNLRQEEEAAEEERLTQVRMSLRQEELIGLVEGTRELKRRQEAANSPEDLALIPMLELEDLDRENQRLPLNVIAAAGSTVLYHDLFTNGIIYLDLGLNLYALPQEYLPYVSLFGRALLEMGTETEDFVKLAQRIGQQTGGIYPTSITSSLADSADGTAWLFLRGKATMSHGTDLLAILRDILTTVRLDNQERFRQMVLEEKASEESDIVPAGHAVVNNRLRAHFNEADWASEQMGGINYLLFLRQLASDIDRDWQSVLDKLETIRRLLINRSTMIFNVTLDAANWQQFQPALSGFIAQFPAVAADLKRWSPVYDHHSEGLIIPSQVNYVGKGADLYKLGYRPHGSIAVINQYLSTAWLWDRIRVRGGAYGAFCVFNRRSGVYTFLSYADPNLKKTLEIYDQTGNFLRNLDLNRDELTKSIIGTIGNIDSYQLPDAKGYTSMLRYLFHESEEGLQQWREEVLSTTAEHFKQFGDVLEQLGKQGLVAVLGPQTALEEAPDLKMMKVL